MSLCASHKQKPWSLGVHIISKKQTSAENSCQPNSHPRVKTDWNSNFKRPRRNPLHSIAIDVDDDEEKEGDEDEDQEKDVEDDEDDEDEDVSNCLSS